VDGAYQDSWNWFNELDVDKSGTLEEEELFMVPPHPAPPLLARRGGAGISERVAVGGCS
jgi:hypothetical protein